MTASKNNVTVQILLKYVKMMLTTKRPLKPDFINIKKVNILTLLLPNQFPSTLAEITKFL